MTEDVQDDIACPFCGMRVSPSAETCPSCLKELPSSPGVTVADESEGDLSTVLRKVAPLLPNELPSGIIWLDRGLVLFIIIVGVLANFGLSRVDSTQILNDWIDSCIKCLEAGEPPCWKQEQNLWPPPGLVKVILMTSGGQSAESAAQNLLARAGLSKSSTFRAEPRELEILIEANRSEQWLVLTIEDNPLGITLDVSFFSPELRGTGLFRWRNSKSTVALYATPLTRLAALLLCLTALRQIWILRYRARRRSEFSAYQKQLTAKLFSEKAQLDEARRLVRDVGVAQALIALKRLLDVNPGYEDALQLRRLLLETPDARPRAVITADTIITQSTSQSNSILYLKVLGTPYAYQAPIDAETVSIGRQRRKPGDPPGAGNDVVVRIPGSEQSSLRISRQHLQIQRIGPDYFIINCSTGLTKLNGRTLKQGEPEQIRSQDNLNLGGVITLEVLIRARIDGGKRQKVLQLEGTSGGSGIMMEATLGDMLTEVGDE